MTGVLLLASDTPLDPGELTEGESAQFAALPTGRRRDGWLTARRALRLALAGAGLPADTSAWPGQIASLSYSAELAVAAVPAVSLRDRGLAGTPVLVLAGVGVDLELDRTPDERIAPFFLTEAEQAWLAGAPAQVRPDAVLRLWTVKEALFKADPGNAGTVLLDYEVADPRAARGCAVRLGADRLAAAGASHEDPEFRYVSIALARGFLTVALAFARAPAPPEEHPQMVQQVQSEGMNAVQTVDFDQMASRISSLISVPIERLTPDVTMAELVPDSFMFVEVAVDLQEEFDVVLSQHDLKDVHTLGDLAALLRARQAGQTPRTA